MAQKFYNKKFATKPSKIARVQREWSALQMAVFNDIANGVGHTQVDALAGSGKTSTLVEGFYHVPEGLSVLFVAFNKSIQLELEARAPESTTVKTLHSLGYAAVRRAFPKVNIDNNKLYNIVANEVGNKDNYEFRAIIAKTVNLSKCYLAQSYQEIDEIINRYDIDVEDKEKFIPLIQKILMNCKNQTSIIDFGDMVWFPNVHNLRMDKFDRVFVDEVQDLDPAQVNLVYNSIKPNGRILSCGDVFQCIYEFKGSNRHTIDEMVGFLNSKRLPLSMTYRCAKNIVKLANTLVPDLEYAPNAEDGLVANISIEKLPEMVKPGDFVLSRTNAPLLKWCLRLLKCRIPANIRGRDVGEDLLSLIKKSRKNTVETFLDWLDHYYEVESCRLIKQKKDPAIISDKIECLQVLCEGVETLQDVIDDINKLFVDVNDKNRVVFSSTHKAKGLERDRVFMLVNTYRTGKSQEEDNITYVAYTRAKKELYLVSGI